MEQTLINILTDDPPRAIANLLLNIIKVFTPAALVALTLIVVWVEGWNRRSIILAVCLVVYLATLLAGISSLMVGRYELYFVSIGSVLRSFTYLIWIVVVIRSVADMGRMIQYVKGIIVKEEVQVEKNNKETQ